MRENPLLASEKQKNKFGLTESACAKGLVRMSSCFRALPLVELMLIILLRSRADLQGKLYGDVFAQTCLISFKESSWIRLCHKKYYRKKVKTNKTTAFFVGLRQVIMACSLARDQIFWPTVACARLEGFGKKTGPCLKTWKYQNYISNLSRSS